MYLLRSVCQCSNYKRFNCYLFKIINTPESGFKIFTQSTFEITTSEHMHLKNYFTFKLFENSEEKCLRLFLVLSSNCGWRWSHPSINVVKHQILILLTTESYWANPLIKETIVCNSHHWRNYECHYISTWWCTVKKGDMLSPFHLVSVN